MVSLREERSNNNEQRLFFNRSVSQTELLLALQPDPTFETTTTVYVNVCLYVAIYMNNHIYSIAIYYFNIRKITIKKRQGKRKERNHE